MINSIAGLYHAILRQDVGVAKTCFFLVCSENKLAYLQWRLPYWISSINPPLIMFYLGYAIFSPSEVWVTIKALLTEKSSGHRAALTMSRVKNAYPEWDQLKEYRARLATPPFWYDASIDVSVSRLLAEPKRPGDFEILIAALFECEIYGYRSNEMTLTILKGMQDKCKEKAATVLPWWCHDWEPYIPAMSKEAGWDLSRVVKFIGHESPGHIDKTRFFYRYYLTEIFGQNVGRAVDVWENYCQCYLKDVIDDT